MSLQFSKTLTYLVLSLAGGIFGSFLFLIALEGGLLTNLLPHYFNVDVPDYSTIQTRNVTTVDESAFERARSVANDRIAFLFVPKVRGVEGTNVAYRERDRIGRGFAVTSDGWFITSKVVFAKYGKKLVMYSPSLDTRTTYPIERVVEDPHSPLAFFKVALPKELGVVSFTTREYVRPGITLMLVEDGETIHVGVAVKVILNTSDLFHSSEEPVGVILFETFGDTPLSLGAALFDFSGRLVALGDASKKFFFTDWGLLLQQLLKGEKLERTYLGVTYVDLETLIGTRGRDVPSQTSGAWLKGGEGAAAVKRGSPADIAGLKEGDIILAVESERITDEISLTELIREYHPGDQVTFSILRNGTIPLDIEVTLGSF